ncbi:7-cyano-7-deazaguanine synthase QueC [Kitasatospora sp. NPDC056076]|uniref:7-cyano-7-deazaguanine synthase QueC n=1 Tax=Kitasatospora sp. NPDC056076 TaxID=3345703 RepID=UPI0035E34614
MSTARDHSVVLLSGGMDSATALALELDRDDQAVTAVSVFYGQRHLRELDSVDALVEHFGVSHVRLDLSGVTRHMGRGGALLHGEDVPEGHYAADNMASTVVPGRNLLFLSAAAALAQSIGAGRVVLGVHSGDHPVYADCRPGFIHHARQVVEASSDNAVSLGAPFLTYSKADIVTTGHQLDVPWHLTRSCYNAGEAHCGRCGTCTERAEAFTLAGVTDPTVYEDPDFWRSVTAPQEV